MDRALLEALTYLPWVLLLAMLPMLYRRKPRIEGYTPPPTEEAPLVSIVVPARNEAINIGACLATLLDSDYPQFEIIVVDDDSADGTRDIALAIAHRSPHEMRIVQGEPLPDGWYGKPWACWQGFKHARAELILFVDADTKHDDALLGHAVGALIAERAHLVTLLPRQILEGFWERVLMPQLIVMLMLRFPSLKRINNSRSARNVLVNGQFVLVRRESYEAVGGHSAVRGEVVEDVALGQRFRAAGLRVFIAHAERLMEVRMYRTLRGIFEGWTKNVARGASMVSGWWGKLAPWVAAIVTFLLWVVPPATLVGAFFFPVLRDALAWSVAVTGVSLIFWSVAHVRVGSSPQSALAYPVGAFAAAWILVRSAVRGERVKWKGREYGRRAGGRD